MYIPWYERFPERLEQELQALRKADIKYVKDDQKEADLQVIELCLELELDDGRNIELTATYPDSFPYFRPAVSSTDLQLSRHQHPVSNNLCLLARPTQNWNPERTLAGHLESQLSKTIAKGQQSWEEATQDDSEQAEPYSTYYPNHSNTSVLIDSSFTIDPSMCSGGEMAIGIKSKSSILIRGALLEIRNDQGQVIHQLPEAVSRFFSETIKGRWYYVDKPLQATTAKEALKRLKATGATVPPRYAQLQVKQGGIHDVLGLAFPEEGSETGWTFIARIRANDPKPHTSRNQAYFMPAMRAGKEDYQARIPELIPLSNKTAVVVGLGCVGSPIAIELAKAGIAQLHLVDHDIVEPANSVRWPLGLPYVGLPKSNALAQFINSNYPYTETHAHRFKIGHPRFSKDETPEWDRVQDIISDCSIIIDASAEEGVNHYLSSIAHNLNLPYLCVDGRPGGWGGLVARVVPGAAEGCWMCLQYALDDGIIAKPPQDRRTGEVQPEGCDDPTFTGAGFDLSTLSLSATRLAASTLCQEDNHGYPQLPWDVGVLSVRSKEGSVQVPRWETHKLEKHPRCPYCS